MYVCPSFLYCPHILVPALKHIYTLSVIHTHIHTHTSHHTSHITQDRSGWWKGTNIKTNKRGWFPGSYLKRMSPTHTQTQSTTHKRANGKINNNNNNNNNNEVKSNNNNNNNNIKNNKNKNNYNNNNNEVMSDVDSTDSDSDDLGTPSHQSLPAAFLLVTSIISPLMYVMCVFVMCLCMCVRV